jgi:glucans biosynthesis protein
MSAIADARRWSIAPLLAALLAAGLPGTAAAAADATVEHVFERVSAQARERAGREAPAPARAVPDELAGLDYDAYRDIRFRPERALWGEDSAFSVQLFHAGYRFEQPVAIHTVTDGRIEPLAFDPARFRYEGAAAHLPRAVRERGGHAGFRVHYPLNTPGTRDELVAFLGASYFRFLSAGQAYGLSARAVAVDTASPRPESFPSFRAFWLFRPAAGADRMTIVALLEGERVTGACRFDVRPGAPTTVTVEARLFARAEVRRLGLAPLTSMFHHGPHDGRPVDDYRPRVHDSEGLAVHTAAGEWIWRPLVNPAAPRTTAQGGPLPRGFGLVQRERRFAAYLDTEAAYHRRPSYWVEPLGGDWGAGHVELYEFPAADETVDNIGAYWVPDASFGPGEARRVRYRITGHDGRLPGHETARVVRTRQGAAGVPGGPPVPAGTRRFVVDFRGGALPGLEAGAAVRARVEARRATLSDVRAARLPDGAWRATFRARSQGARPLDLRAWLEHDGERLTETWNFVGGGHDAD